jgi:hypothetical protein
MRLNTQNCHWENKYVCRDSERLSTPQKHGFISACLRARNLLRPWNDLPRHMLHTGSLDLIITEGLHELCSRYSISIKSHSSNVNTLWNWSWWHWPMRPTGVTSLLLPRDHQMVYLFLKTDDGKGAEKSSHCCLPVIKWPLGSLCATRKA